MNWLEAGWYNRHKQTHLLWPLTWLFSGISAARRLCYRLGLKKQIDSRLPVIVVGNITVGGTGKTPFVLYLCSLLKAQGYRPAIVSRGYGANKDSGDFPRLIVATSDVGFSGDEPKLLAMRSGCPVVIAPKRVEAVEYVCRHTDADIIISDDGLQHYAMGRSMEIVLIDGDRKLGNGHLLPVGPLREPESRLRSVDLVVENAGFISSDSEKTDHYRLTTGKIYNLLDPGQTLDLKAKNTVHLVSGIGNPERFVQTALGVGLSIAASHWFADHHDFKAADFSQLAVADDEILLMTEKDAVKCASFAKANWYALPISAEISDSLESEIIRLVELKCKTNTRSHHGL